MFSRLPIQFIKSYKSFSKLCLQRPLYKSNLVVRNYSKNTSPKWQEFFNHISQKDVRFKLGVMVTSLVLSPFVFLRSRLQYQSYEDFVNDVNDELVSGIYVEPNRALVELSNGEKYCLEIGTIKVFMDKLNATNEKTHSLAAYMVKNKSPNTDFLFYYVILIIVSIALLLRKPISALNLRMNMPQVSMFDEMFNVTKFQTKVRKNVKLADVAGCDEAKSEVVECVHFLKDPDEYYNMGAKIPRGVILTGPPGTGKTMLAMAVANEAKVSFFSASGSEFMTKFQGSGPNNVKNLFKNARMKSPSVVFIDEIDSIGKKRLNTGLNNSSESTLNQLLTEMDGFLTDKNVIVIAATNQFEVLDPALLRPGRFTRKISVDLPDIKGRYQIFMIHLKPIKTRLPKESLARQLAALSPGLSGADIANVCNEAGIIAARLSANSVTLEHFNEAVSRSVVGLLGNRILKPDERKLCAYHEAGHAVTGWFLKNCFPVTKVSIVPRGKGLGYAQFLPDDLNLIHQEQFMDMMCGALGGRVAEDIFFNITTTGAINDLQNVTQNAYNQVAKLGFDDDVGKLSYSPPLDTSFMYSKPYSEELAEKIDERVRELVDSAYKRTKELLLSKKDLVEELALRLLDRDNIDRDDLIEILGARPFKDKTTYEQFVGGSS